MSLPQKFLPIGLNYVLEQHRRNVSFPQQPWPGPGALVTSITSTHAGTSWSHYPRVEVRGPQPSAGTGPVQFPRPTLSDAKFSVLNLRCASVICPASGTGYPRPSRSLVSESPPAPHNSFPTTSLYTISTSSVSVSNSHKNCPFLSATLSSPGRCHLAVADVGEANSFMEQGWAGAVVTGSVLDTVTPAALLFLGRVDSGC